MKKLFFTNDGHGQYTLPHEVESVIPSYDIEAYLASEVDALVEAAKKYLDGNCMSNRNALIDALADFEQSGNTGELEDSHEGL